MEPDFYDYKTTVRLSVTNDTLSTVTGEAVGYLRDSGGKIIKTTRKAVTVKPLSVLTLDEEDFNKTDVENNYYSYELIVNGEVISEGSVLFTAPKHFKFKDPHLKARISGDEIIVTADAYAKSVEIDSLSSDFLLSDNYFDMNAGEKRVKILKGNAENIRLRSVFDIR